MNFANMKDAQEPFRGYGEETFDFLWGIRMNNNREWFREHKEQYERWLYRPTKALAREVFDGFDQPGLLCKVSRIYRDARLHHPDPYKESLWMCIRQDVEWWSENPCLYFEIRPEGASYGFLFWQPRVAVMERFRQETEANPTGFAKLLVDTEAAVGQAFTARSYKRPKPCGSQEVGPWYQWKADIECCFQVAPGPELFTPELAQTVRRRLLALLPMCNYWQTLADSVR